MLEYSRSYSYSNNTYANSEILNFDLCDLEK
jgi:hypothetical protein